MAHRRLRWPLSARSAPPITPWQGPDWLRHLVRQPLEQQAAVIYQQMLLRLQRQLLIVVVSLGIVFSIPFALQTARSVWVLHTYPVAVFTIQLVRTLLILILTSLLLWHDRVAVAWTALISISLSTTLLLMRLVGAPGLLVFALFSLAGPALLMSARRILSLTAAMIALTYLIGRDTFVRQSTEWITTAIIFGSVMLVLTGFGVMIRRFLAQFAHTTVAIEQEAIRHSQVSQQVVHLSAHMRQIALLEHDLRQPLKAVQGNLLSLDVPPLDAEELVAPALAAALRAERLVSNLLDQARLDARQHRLIRRRTDLHALLDRLGATLPGLARYYTDPPIPIHLLLDPPPLRVDLDPEQFERALLNLLDNALAHAPPDSAITVRLTRAAQHLQLEVHDAGPGIPSAVLAALRGDAPAPDTAVRTGFGLQQVQLFATTHQGQLTFTTSAHGTIVRLTIPAVEEPHEDRRDC